MCGIVAAIAHRNSVSNVVPILLEGLSKLEYRGYDSAGLAVLNAQGLQSWRALGRVAELRAQVHAEQASGQVGIAHTRWATHGVPAERNAHPHCSHGIAVVHNGIIENHESLRQRLIAAGYLFTSDTDSEVIAHLLAYEVASAQHADFLSALRSALRQLQGAYALAIMDAAQPERLFVARQGSPLLIGIAASGVYAASDAAALLQVTRRMVYLENGDCAELSADGYRISRLDGSALPLSARPEVESQLSAAAVELGNYRHFMQKEIFEQPAAVANTLEMISQGNSLQAGVFGAAAESVFAQVQQVLILACGTSYHAGCLARYWLEALAGLPCSVEIASEYRYRQSVPNEQTLVITLSQSGETADTLAALQHAQALGMRHSLAICNVAESSLVRATKLRFITRAGPEIGVASTKAFTTQLAALYLLSLVLAKQRAHLSVSDEHEQLHALRHLPLALSKVLMLEEPIRAWAERIALRQHALFLGRGPHYPIAQEGALKLKEISYIHAEAYPAGELKHGPLALVDHQMPVIAVAPNDALLEKLKSNLQEVRARGGELYVLADADSSITPSEGLHLIRFPEPYSSLSPILHVVPLQLLAYHVALVRGTDVDKPRNLAKSVTVE
ncbi:MAG: glutamine--fructose-6-phosphate transaminase (isomerizing) [Pseudomonadota bacterium]